MAFSRFASRPHRSFVKKYILPLNPQITSSLSFVCSRPANPQISTFPTGTTILLSQGSLIRSLNLTLIVFSPVCCPIVQSSSGCRGIVLRNSAHHTIPTSSPEATLPSSPLPSLSVHVLSASPSQIHLRAVPCSTRTWTRDDALLRVKACIPRDLYRTLPPTVPEINEAVHHRQSLFVSTLVFNSDVIHNDTYLNSPLPAVGYHCIPITSTPSSPFARALFTPSDM